MNDMTEPSNPFFHVSSIRRFHRCHFAIASRGLTSPRRAKKRRHAPALKILEIRGALQNLRVVKPYDTSVDYRCCDFPVAPLMFCLVHAFIGYAQNRVDGVAAAAVPVALTTSEVHLWQARPRAM